MNMSGSVTARAKRNEIHFGFIPQAAARAEVVNLEIARFAATLAAPAIACEHLAGRSGDTPGFEP